MFKERFCKDQIHRSNCIAIGVHETRRRQDDSMVANVLQQEQNLAIDVSTRRVLGQLRDFRVDCFVLKVF